MRVPEIQNRLHLHLQDDLLTPELKEGIEIAESFEKLLFLSSPDAKRFILYIDIHLKDRHLLLSRQMKTFAVRKLQAGPDSNVYIAVHPLLYRTASPF